MCNRLLCFSTMWMSVVEFKQSMAVLKPVKNAETVSSYRPIILLSCLLSEISQKKIDMVASEKK